MRVISVLALLSAAVIACAVSVNGRTEDQLNRSGEDGCPSGYVKLDEGTCVNAEGKIIDVGDDDTDGETAEVSRRGSRRGFKRRNAWKTIKHATDVIGAGGDIASLVNNFVPSNQNAAEASEGKSN